MLHAAGECWLPGIGEALVVGWLTYNEGAFSLTEKGARHVKRHMPLATNEPCDCFATGVEP